MRRSLSILVWILVGALASGISLGYFLHRSNQERLELLFVAQAAQQELHDAKYASEQLTQEANRKITQAEQEVFRQKELVKQLEQEQMMLRDAVPLSRPVGYYRTWQERVSVPLKLSLRVPSRNESWENDLSMGIGSGTMTSRQGMEQWFSVSAYDEQRFQNMIQQVVDPRTVAFVVDGRLLTGTKGGFSSLEGTTYILRDYTQGSSTLLLWARTNKDVTEQKLLDTLASLSFGK